MAAMLTSRTQGGQQAACCRQLSVEQAYAPSFGEQSHLVPYPVASRLGFKAVAAGFSKQLHEPQAKVWPWYGFVFTEALAQAFKLRALP